MVAARLALVAVAAVAALTATGVRIGNHPGYVRVVVDFNGRVPASEVVFDKLTGTMATAHIAHPGIKTQTTGKSGRGVHVALQPGTQALHIAASFAKHRFKYVSYDVVGGNRLAIDLWKSTPPPKGTTTGVGDCLSIDYTMGTSNPSSSTVEVAGTEHSVFEHTFEVVLRDAAGRVLSRRNVTHKGPWDVKMHYHSSHAQNGTIEAVAFSAKDGSLACLAQQQTPLFAS
jgi:hypothetical protein